MTPTQPRPTLLTRRWREELPGLSDLPILPHQGLAIETAAGTDLLVIGTASAEAIDLVPAWPGSQDPDQGWRIRNPSTLPCSQHPGQAR